MVTFLYWTGLIRYCGNEIGGEVKAKISQKEYQELKELALSMGKESGIFEEKMPKLYVRIRKIAYTALKNLMIDETIEYYDFSSPEYKGWSRRKKRSYLKKNANPDYSFEDNIIISLDIPDNL